MYGDTVSSFVASPFKLGLNFDIGPIGDVAAAGQFPLSMNIPVKDEYLSSPEPRSCLDDFFKTLFFFQPEEQAHASADVIWPQALEAICESDQSDPEKPGFSSYSFPVGLDLGLSLTMELDPDRHYFYPLNPF